MTIKNEKSNPHTVFFHWRSETASGSPPGINPSTSVLVHIWAQTYKALKRRRWMNKKSHHSPGLRLIQGHLHCAWSFASLKIVAAPEHVPPFDIDALVFEEDTWLTMSAEPTVCEPEIHPIRLMTELIEMQPEKVGSVLVQGGDPVRLLAVVHNVDEEPTWRASWIESALSELFCVVQKRGFKSIGLPFIGTRHGKLSAPQFAVILGRVMRKAKWDCLENLWLISPVGVNRTVMSILKNALL